MQSTPEVPASGETSGVGIIIGFGVVVLLVAAYFAFGMPGMDHGSPASPSQGSAMRDMPGMTARTKKSTRLAPDAFAARVRAGAFVINVHVPYSGEIEGTNAFIPFDRIVGDAELPSNEAASIALYCRSGRMSAIAASALAKAGYTRVTELDGGLDAWKSDGRPVLGTHRNYAIIGDVDLDTAVRLTRPDLARGSDRRDRHSLSFHRMSVT